MNRKTLLLMGVVLTIIIVAALVAFTFSSNGARTLSSVVQGPHATMTLKISDTETGRLVDDVSVLVDGLSARTTVHNGELDVPNVKYGRHRISLLVPYYEQCKVDNYVDINGDTVVPVSIDMPNPVFQASVSVQTHLEPLNEYGSVSITLANTGEVVSQDTIALAFTYMEENLTTPIATRIVNFGNIAVGAQPIQRSIPRMDEFVWLKSEHVAVVIIDRWKYTPENNQVVSQVNAPTALSEQIVSQANTYLQQHPEITGTTAKIIIASS